jgi:ATP/maltotriose-dependent transcriptional regulator MalT
MCYQARSAAFQPELEVQRSALLAYLGRFDEARSLLAETIARMNERGLALFAASSMQTAWRIEMLAGDHAAAERLARHGCEQLQRLGEQSWLSTQACQLADALYALGRNEESEQWALRGLERGSADDLATQVYGLGVRSKLLARKGEIGAAIALSEKADSLARTSDALVDQGYAALNHAEVMYLADNWTGAQDAARRAMDCYRRKGAVACVARAQRLAAGWASGSSTASGVTQARQDTAGSGHAP